MCRVYQGNVGQSLGRFNDGNGDDWWDYSWWFKSKVLVELFVLYIDDPGATIEKELPGRSLLIHMYISVCLVSFTLLFLNIDLTHPSIRGMSVALLYETNPQLQKAVCLCIFYGCRIYIYIAQEHLRIWEYVIPNSWLYRILFGYASSQLIFLLFFMHSRN